jgi:hypothetical protein
VGKPHTDRAAIDTCFVTAPGGRSEGAEIGRFDGKLVMEESDRDEFSILHSRFERLLI